MAVFTPDEYDEICERAIVRGLHQYPRELLFANVMPEYVNRLKLIPQWPDAQLRSDVNQMNQDGPLGTNHFPLFRWLRNARGALSSYPDDQQYFREMGDRAELWQAQQSAVRNQVPAADRLPATASAVAATSDEDILFESDLLPVGFLAGAARTARSVCRISVPRYVSGNPQLAGGRPSSAAGTAWLIGKRHIITNYHVVSARVRGEGDPGPADLDLQVRNAELAFGYDDETSMTTTIPIVGLRAFDAGLDFAIAELAEEAASEPLPLLDKQLLLDEGHRVQVNIIQHPGGFAKQIAIRNNLAVTVDSVNLAYYTDTDKGSSGSPVCDDNWRVVALHKATTRMLGKFRYQGKETAWVNIGTPITLIVDHLRNSQDETLKALWEQIGATVVSG